MEKQRNLTTQLCIRSMYIKPIKLSKNAGYKYVKTSKELLEIYKAKKWMDEDVDLINPEKSIFNPNNDDTNPLDAGVVVIDYKMKYEALMIQHEELKQKHVPIPVIQSDSDSDDDMDDIATAIFNNVCKKK